MKILLCHNYYQQPGGEDLSFEAEAALLESKGHSVSRFTMHNDSIDSMNSLSLASSTLWNRDCYRKVLKLVKDERPQIVHCTNTFPLISPAVYYAAKAGGAAVVQSLRNYRLLCPNSYFLRAGKVCEDCLGKKVPIPSIVHGCYRQSHAASAVVVSMLLVHRALGTWRRAVDLFVSPSAFTKSKYVEGRIDEKKIRVKPNFIDPDPGVGEGSGDFALYVGRLSPEKGIDTLLSAWQQLGPTRHLKILGDGPLASRAVETRDDGRIEWMGRRSSDEVLRVMGDASCVIVPSIWYETFGRIIIEAFAKGVPVIVSRLGAMRELVDDGRTGLYFDPDNPADLAMKVERIFVNSELRATMSKAARSEYKKKFTAERNYKMLLGIYEEAISARGETLRSRHAVP